MLEKMIREKNVSRQFRQERAAAEEFLFEDQAGSTLFIQPVHGRRGGRLTAL
ncbi:MAG: hypothetical protein WB919_22335 [Candidatus Sulfotelmatobacter sp.]